MLQSRGRADLREEPLASEGRAEVGVQHLDRDVAIVPDVVREVHCRHPTRAQLSHDAVAVGERRRDAGNRPRVRRCHRMPSTTKTRETYSRAE